MTELQRMSINIKATINSISVKKILFRRIKLPTSWSMLLMEKENI